MLAGGRSRAVALRPGGVDATVPTIMQVSAPRTRAHQCYSEQPHGAPEARTPITARAELPTTVAGARP
jgi:hypothetical protein